MRASLLIAIVLSASTTWAQGLDLSPDERAWIEANPVVRIGPAPNFPPIEFFDEEGNYRGLAAEVVDQISASTGLRFEVVRCKSWGDMLERTAAGEIDVWAEAAITPERQKSMNFTRPWLHLPTAILTRPGQGSGLRLSDLRGKKVVVVAGYANHDYVKAQVPDLELITVPDLRTGLRLVSFGGGDAIVASLGPASYYIQDLGITNLRVAGEADFTWHLAFASRKELPELSSILQKALDRIPAAEHQRLKDRWIRVSTPAWRPSSAQIAVSGGALIALIAIGVLLWNRELRRRIEARTQQLHASEQALRTLIDTVPDGIFVVDAEGRVTDSNARAAQLWDPKGEGLVGRALGELLFPGQPASLRAEKQAAWGGTPQRCEREARLPGGEPCDLALSLEAIQLGEVPGLLVSVRDVREQRRLERMQSEFVATISHELRTPLTAIHGALGLLEHLPHDAEEAAELVRVAARNSERLTRLVDDVIDVERLARGDLRFEFLEQPLRPLLEQSVAVNAPYGVRLGVSFVLGEVAEVTVRVDEARLSQVLANLLSNAAKFSPKGAEVTLSAEVRAERVAILVQDRGPGIPEDFQERVFQRFAQADGPNEAKGTGLGLAICREIVTRLDGEISFETAPDEGTTFAVELPLSEASAVQD